MKVQVETTRLYLMGVPKHKHAHFYTQKHRGCETTAVISECTALTCNEEGYIVVDGALHSTMLSPDLGGHAQRTLGENGAGSGPGP